MTLPRPSDHPTTVERAEWTVLLRHNYGLAQTILRYRDSHPEWLVLLAAEVPRRDSRRAELVVWIAIILSAAYAVWRYRQ